MAFSYAYSTDLSNKMLLPLRLITQKHPQYFQDKHDQPRERLEQYGCGSDVSTVEGYPCVESLVTHYEQQSVQHRLGLAINALILYHCLCALEYLPTTPQLDSFNLFVPEYLHQYIAVAK